jgi:hypothetical protein
MDSKKFLHSESSSSRSGFALAEQPQTWPSSIRISHFAQNSIFFLLKSTATARIGGMSDPPRKGLTTERFADLVILFPNASHFAAASLPRMPIINQT